MPATDAQKSAAKDNPVSVKLMRDKQTQKPYLRVELRSRVKPEQVAMHPIYDLTNGDRLRRGVQTAGGALAEHQNEILGDHHDPSECAHMATEALARLVSFLREQGVVS